MVRSSLLSLFYPLFPMEHLIQQVGLVSGAQGALEEARVLLCNCAQQICLSDIPLRGYGAVGLLRHQQPKAIVSC